MNYQRIYNSIIERAKSEVRTKGGELYFEKHHIMPRSMGGYDSHDNLVLLTGREHYIAHCLLWKMYNNLSMANALFFMSSVRGGTIKNSKMFENVRIVVSERFRERIPPRLGVMPTMETRIKQSESLKGRVLSEETKKKISIKNTKTIPKTSKFSDEHRKHISESKKGKQRPEHVNQILAACNEKRKKKVVQMTIDFEEIAIYNSIGEAADTLNISSASIKRCLRGLIKATHGFRWKLYIP